MRAKQLETAQPERAGSRLGATRVRVRLKHGCWARTRVRRRRAWMRDEPAPKRDPARSGGECREFQEDDVRTLNRPDVSSIA